ncbi:MAG: class I tRNA ligase family protein, partial [Bdellovibrionales bacterium]|nr:class I tRNA ligase family protein [Bdellovibrionales bacterium]
MAVRFFNSRSRRIEVFDPIEPGKVRMYSCGPTVYNYAHIGNLRAFVFCDLLKRYLRYRSYDVLHVMNITDVDDKTIRGSVASGKALAEYTDFYLAEFLKDFATLSIQEP